MFWIICAATTIIVGLAIMAPLLRRGQAAAEPAAAFDLRVYRDQLREVERDLERGVIAPEDAERLRTEIGRKVLDADRRMAQAATGGAGGRGLLAVALLAMLFAGAAALYLREGQPGRDDLPIARRIALAEAAYDSRPSQAEAEAEAPRPQAPEVPADYASLIQQLREAVAKNPDDPQGLALLATNEMRLGNMAAAREAQQRLIDLRGDDATAGELVRLSALMIEAAGGVITPDAEGVLARALRKDPAHPQARYLLGMLQLQNDRPDRAFPVWRRLLEEGPEDAPWIAPIRAAITDLAWLAGQPDYVPPAPLPGPDAQAMAAAEDMSPEDRQQMIAGMVSQLEARLAQQGGTPEEWARLISSLVVIGNADHAREIWTEAQTRFAAQPEALDIVRQAATQAGLTQ
ncbi:c-type cytochrome biogenesis protein CcmI [Paracoccus benzoatiresistens]|uniref:C-type cytochrome biogenesis protein CcmI n=1 Tax=Paracoccus benzoatiresistens TaxID=2997341 RepID=A0ABT4J0C2_9RHOB|nr:c-type cytochrome biogenesis protein CcmI [Paracoccus sp. EF6]MCZ0960339.1 c-type cytochrome biogenesis protein CcmI [Paracoccus sp. EF6]